VTVEQTMTEYVRRVVLPANHTCFGVQYEKADGGLL
jgi:hypothetical protein